MVLPLEALRQRGKRFKRFMDIFEEALEYEVAEQPFQDFRIRFDDWESFVTAAEDQLPGDLKSQKTVVRTLVRACQGVHVGRRVDRVFARKSNAFDYEGGRLVEVGNNNSYRLLYVEQGGSIIRFKVLHFDKLYR